MPSIHCLNFIFTILAIMIRIFTLYINEEKRANKARLLKEEDVMTENNQDMVDKPNPSSEKKLKLPKKSQKYLF